MGLAKVVLRLKPKSTEADDSVQVIDSAEAPALLIKKNDSEDGLYQFSFTRVLSAASQAQTYEACGREIVESVLQGYNGTIMAYGQTGAGKTHTMTGRDGGLADGEDRGLVLRTIGQIFESLQRGSLLQWQVRISYLEIYNESFRDLLQPATPSADLVINENKGVIRVKNLTCEECNTAQQAAKLLAKGQANRHIAAHNLNSDSSRSHAIISVWLDTIDSEGSSVSSKLNLVDLAGSERFAKTGTHGSVLKEAMHINKSLTFLEQTVVALARKQAYIPYRSSKLTHFLKDSLGGNCRTLLVACIWSDAEQLSETISTCRFAQRMLQVAENAQKNTGGLSSVHGNLFKLDPIMQQYLESMTAAAVAKEKAQLYAEFARLRDRQSAELGDAEMSELETLRLRVRELELQSRPVEGLERQAVSDDSELVVVGLRGRVQQLERDIAAANALQSQRESHVPEEADEDTKESPERHKHNQSESSNIADCSNAGSSTIGRETLEGEEQTTGEGNTVLTQVSSLADFLAEDGPSEAAVLESRVVSRPWPGHSSPDVTELVSLGAEGTSEVDNLSEVPPMSNGKSSMQSSPDVAARQHEFYPQSPGQASMQDEQWVEEADFEDPALDKDDGHLVVSLPGSAMSTPEGVTPSKWATTLTPPAQAERIFSRGRDVPLNSPPAKSESRVSTELVPRPPSQSIRAEPVDFKVPPLSAFSRALEEEFNSSHTLREASARERRSRKKGFLARLFSKKEEEHDSFSQFGPVENFEEENTAPNIVILNSLNHNQLLELLKKNALVRGIGFQATLFSCPTIGAHLKIAASEFASAICVFIEFRLGTSACKGSSVAQLAV